MMTLSAMIDDDDGKEETRKKSADLLFVCVIENAYPEVI